MCDGWDASGTDTGLGGLDTGALFSSLSNLAASAMGGCKHSGAARTKGGDWVGVGFIGVCCYTGVGWMVVLF